MAIDIRDTVNTYNPWEQVSGALGSFNSMLERRLAANEARRIEEERLRREEEENMRRMEQQRIENERNQAADRRAELEHNMNLKAAEFKYKQEKDAEDRAAKYYSELNRAEGVRPVSSELRERPSMDRGPSKADLDSLTLVEDGGKPTDRSVGVQGGYEATSEARTNELLKPYEDDIMSRGIPSEPLNKAAVLDKALQTRQIDPNQYAMRRKELMPSKYEEFKESFLTDPQVSQLLTEVERNPGAVTKLVSLGFERGYGEQPFFNTFIDNLKSVPIRPVNQLDKDRFDAGREDKTRAQVQKYADKITPVIETATNLSALDSALKNLGLKSGIYTRAKDAKGIGYIENTLRKFRQDDKSEDMRTAINFIKTAQRNNWYGATLTDNELSAFNETMETGVLSSSYAMLSAMRKINEAVREKVKAQYAGLSESAKKIVQDESVINPNSLPFNGANYKKEKYAEKMKIVPSATKPSSEPPIGFVKTNSQGAKVKYLGGGKWQLAN